jgi:hypothetical protein
MADRDLLAEQILFKYRLKARGMTEEDMIKAMRDYHKAADDSRKVRECLSCGAPLSDYCPQCQHLWET